MRTSRPSGKAVLVAGALAMTLVVAATTGAVAGNLITSKDIKNNTIKSKDIRNNGVKNNDLAAGSVTWDKSFDQATKDQIEALAGDGPAGPAGPAGQAGPAGPAGAAGSNAELVAWNTFDGAGVFDPMVTGPLAGMLPIGYVSLTGAQPAVVVSEPGTYLVSIRATTDITDLAAALEMDITALLGLFGIISPSQPISVATDTVDTGTEIQNSMTATVDTEALSRSCLSIVVCNTTFAVTVSAGQPLDISNLSLLTLSPTMCEGTEAGDPCATPVKVNVAVSKVDGTPPPFITVDPYEVSICTVEGSGDPCTGAKKPGLRQLKGFIQDLVPAS